MVENLTSRGEMDQFLLESVINTMPIFIYWKNVNLIYLGCNKHYATINGIENPSDILGKIDENLPWSEYRSEEIRKSDLRVLKNNVPEYNIIESWILPNGNEVIYNTNRTPIRNADGNTIGILATYEDITEKIFLERGLKESEQKYRLIAENANDLIDILDETTKIEYRNSVVTKRIFGYTDEEVVDKPALDRVHPEDKSELAEFYKKSFKIGEGMAQFRYRHKDGHYLWLESKGKSFIDSEGNKKFLMISRDITDRKISEQKVKESETKYRIFLQNFQGIAYHAKPLNFKPVFIYGNVEEITGYSRMDFINGKITWDNIIYPDDLPKIIQEGEKRESIPEYIVNLVYRIVHKSGKVKWVNDINQTLYDPSGEISFIQGSIYDITELMEAEQKLKESEEKFRMLTELLPDTIFEYDLEGQLTYLNKAGMEKFGVSQDDIDNNFNAFQFFQNSDELEKAKKNMKASIQGKEFAPTDYLMNTMNGEELYARVHSRPKYEKGKIVGVRGVVIDITENKLIEAKLRESEAKYRHLFNSTPYAIWLIDLRGKIVDCNDTMNKFMSVFKHEDLIGKSFREVIQMFLSKGDPRFENLENVFKERFKLLLKQGYLDPIEFEISRGDAKTFWITLETSFVTLGKERLIQAFIKDITERKVAELKIKQSEEELKKLNKELEQKVKERTKELEEKNLELMELDRAKDDFISMAAHELKTPLISISGYTDFILTKHEDDLPLDIKEDLKIVKKNVTRLQGLMNQLLNVMKLESQSIKILKEKNNISDTIYRCLHELSYLFKAKDLEVVLNIDNEIILNTDSNLIFQVFSNLISNSVKFTPKGGRIEISAKKGDDKYLFEVKDTGIGLARDELPRLFKKFETIKQEGDDSFQAGTGLGLYISKGFIEAHGGEMWATSEGEYKGMAIHFTIPY